MRDVPVDTVRECSGYQAISGTQGVRHAVSNINNQYDKVSVALDQQEVIEL